MLYCYLLLMTSIMTTSSERAPQMR